MAANDKELLKERVLQYLKQQNHFDETQSVRVFYDNDLYFILYEAEVPTGIAGFGETIDGAFNDFTDNWSMYKQKQRV
jgi:hypothetical protein